MAYDIRIDPHKILVYKSKQSGRWVVSPPSCIRYKDKMTSYEYNTYTEAISDTIVVRVLIIVEKRKRAGGKDE